MTLGDDDPLWGQHDGGSGHRDYPEWSEDDGERAAVFYAAIPARARLFLDLLIDRSGWSAGWGLARGPADGGREHE